MRTSPLCLFFIMMTTWPHAMEKPSDKEAFEWILFDIPLPPTHHTAPVPEKIDILAIKMCLDSFRKYSLWSENYNLDWQEEFTIHHPIASLSCFSGDSILGLTFKHPRQPEVNYCESLPVYGHYSWAANQEKSPKQYPFSEQRDLFGTLNLHRKDNLISIVFRGSQNLMDCFYHNFYVVVKDPKTNQPVLPEGHEIHEGYHDLPYEGPLNAGVYNRVMSCKKRLLKNLWKLLREVDQPELLITGHSLGGACACILAGMIMSDRDLASQFSQIFLRPFGAPRVSEASFGRWLRDRGVNLKHYVRETDPVPNLPTLQVSGEYRYYEDICERSILDSFDVPLYRPFLRHDIRLYWVSLAKKANISLSSLPLFRLNLDHDNVNRLLNGETDVYEGNWWEIHMPERLSYTARL